MIPFESSVYLCANLIHAAEHELGEMSGKGQRAWIRERVMLKLSRAANIHGRKYGLEQKLGVIDLILLSRHSAPLSSLSDRH